ncbi:hypothetical protein GJ744_004609 [Endocarpon pusillum]|uniref:Uncharacterized protein n=1 Tax=Endocarpon pusillum TaxID=364733 RepID=A0A8H7E7N1_9EURO|nr:hypothetical protein GJ744_004609 [Endocarpon pusillum]
MNDCLFLSRLSDTICINGFATDYYAPTASASSLNQVSFAALGCSMAPTVPAPPLSRSTSVVKNVVERISDVFRSPYRYEVQEIPLPHRQKVRFRWPWMDESLIDDRDLQIIY